MEPPFFAGRAYLRPGVMGLTRGKTRYPDPPKTEDVPRDEAKIGAK
jgi:hypothetical protein